MICKVEKSPSNPVYEPADPEKTAGLHYNAMKRPNYCGLYATPKPQTLDPTNDSAEIHRHEPEACKI